VPFGTLIYAETSAYGVRDNSLNTQKSLQNNSILSMRQKIKEQQERIEGLTTIIEGLSASVNKLNIANKNTTKTIYELKYMLKNNKIAFKEKANKEINKIEKNTSINKSSKILYSEGVRHFVKHHYSEAKKRFIITSSKGYKPAISNYYLGEIAYYTKQYKDAISYFKKSVEIKDKTSYIDTLLLHSAISLDKTGKKQKAKIFYQNIIDNYPNNKTAKISRDRIKKL